MSDRPWSLDDLRQGFLYQIAGPPADRRRQAGEALKNSDQFRATAQFAVDNELTGSAVSNLHEAARLAVTAQAAADGFRFTSAQGGHAAVDDYALAAGLVTRTEWAQLDALRDLRNSNNYPADITSPPSQTEVEQFAALVDKIRGEVAKKLSPPRARRVPPPPKQK